MVVRVNLSLFTNTQKKKVEQELVISQKETHYVKNPIIVYPYDVNKDDIVSLPFDYANRLLKRYPNDDIKYSASSDYNFSRELREVQQDVVNELVELFNKYRCGFLSLPTGFGKTFISIYLASKVHLKTLIIVHRSLLVQQWNSSIEKTCPTAKIQYLSSTSPIDKEADLYIISILSLLKRDDLEFIGFLICDEAHVLCSSKFSRGFLKVQPKFLLGLSATPRRTDGLDKLLDFYFGDSFIKRTLYVPHTVYKLSTGIVPEVEYNFKGELEWNSVLKSQASHELRNCLIISIIKTFKDRNILVLCKRVVQSQTLFSKLKEEKEDVDLLIRNSKKYRYECRVLISTYSKTGVGFDKDNLDMLIVASDVEELFEQYFGRCTRRPDVKPIVIDLVDDLKTLEKHWRTRKNYYLRTGGVIKEFGWNEFPEMKYKSFQ